MDKQLNCIGRNTLYDVGKKCAVISKPPMSDDSTGSLAVVKKSETAEAFEPAEESAKDLENAEAEAEKGAEVVKAVEEVAEGGENLAEGAAVAEPAEEVVESVEHAETEKCAEVAELAEEVAEGTENIVEGATVANQAEVVAESAETAEAAEGWGILALRSRVCSLEMEAAALRSQVRFHVSVRDWVCGYAVDKCNNSTGFKVQCAAMSQSSQLMSSAAIGSP